MGIIGDYERRLALIKEQKPRDLVGHKIDSCGMCPRLWQNYKDKGYGLCQAVGFRIICPDVMCRMCPMPLWVDKDEYDTK